MSLRFRITLLLVLGAVLPAVLLGAWALASSRASVRAAEAASLSAIQHQTLAKNLSSLEEAAGQDGGLINAARSLSYTAARYLANTHFLSQTSPSTPPATGSGWHFLKDRQMALYIPKGIGISPDGNAEIARSTAVADFLDSQPTLSYPFRLTVVSQTGLTWSYPATASVDGGPDPRLNPDYYLAALPKADPKALPVWTGIHKSPYSGVDVVTLLTPIARPGTFYGVVAVDVPISALVQDPPWLPGASNVLIDQTGWEVVSSEGPASPLTGPGANVSTMAPLAPMLLNLQNGKAGTSQVALNGHSYLLSYTPIGSSALSVASLLPASHVVSNAAAVTHSIRSAAFGHVANYAFALAALTALLLALGIWASVSVFRRLRVFGDRAMAFGQDMSIRLDDRRRDEVSALARGFNRMAERVQRLTGHLEEEVRDRTALLERQASALYTVNDLGRRLMAARDRDEIARMVVDTLEALGYSHPALEARPRTGRSSARVSASGDRLFVAADGVDLLGILPAVAAEVGAALENLRLFALEEERQNEVRRQAVTEERARLSREIHDTLAQAFMGIILHLRTLDGVGNEAARRHHEAALSLATRGLEEARRSVLNLRPDILEGRRLDQALGEVLERWSDLWDVSVSARMDPVAIHPDRAFALLRILQEGLENVRKHSGADRVEVGLTDGGAAVRLTIRDNGRGFTAETPTGGHGMAFMAERAEALGGAFAARSDDGALLEVEVPKREEIA